MSANQPPPPPGPPGPPGPPAGPPGGYGDQPPFPQPGVPAGGVKPGEILNRFLARLIDHIILNVIYVPLYFILNGIIVGFAGSFGELFIFWTIMAIFQAVLFVGYFAFLESNRGQTVGKMAMKLKTVGPDGVSNPTMEQAVRRNFYAGLGILGIIPFIGWFLLGWAAPLAAMIFIAITLNNDQPNHQGWHDKFAGGTRVLQMS